MALGIIVIVGNIGMIFTLTSILVLILNFLFFCKNSVSYRNRGITFLLVTALFNFV